MGCEYSTAVMPTAPQKENSPTVKAGDTQQLAPAKAPVSNKPMSREMELIGITRKTWQQVNPAVSAALFYKRLFEIDPGVEVLFDHVDMKLQGEMLMVMIGNAVDMLEQPHKLAALLKASGRRHLKYGVQSSHYDTVGKALLWTLEQQLGAQWDKETKLAWNWVYACIAQLMQQGAAEHTTEGDSEKQQRQERKDKNAARPAGATAGAALKQSATPQDNAPPPVTVPGSAPSTAAVPSAQ